VILICSEDQTAESGGEDRASEHTDLRGGGVRTVRECLVCHQEGKRVADAAKARGAKKVA
jgi:hypothetical protein